MKTCRACGHRNPDSATVCQRCRMSLDPNQQAEKTVLSDPAKFTIIEGDVIATRYRIVRELGAGGMGEVYLAEDLLMDGEQCAIKIIHPRLMQNPEARQRFKSEVSTSRKLRHPAIVQVFDLGRSDNNFYYFTMEYLEGKTLKELLVQRQGSPPPFTPAEIRLVMTPLLDGLSYAHRQTIHRDIKPDNIMVEGEFPAVKIKILDFGIARTMSASRFTQTAQGLGTPYYMAPEQLQNAHAIDKRADLYGVGMILYELLTNTQAVGRFKLPARVLSSNYAPLDPVVETALAPDPADRYPDAPAMLAALDTALARTEENLNPEPQKTAPEPQTEPSPENKEKNEKESGKKGNKKNLLPIFAGLTVLLLVVGFSYFSLRGGDKSDPTVEKPASPAHIEQPAVDPRAEQLAECEQHRINRAWQQAETCYRAALEKFPDEQQAKAGLDTIYQQIVAAGRRAVEQGDLNAARKQLALLESFAGAGDSAQALQEQIGDYEKQQEITAQKAKEEKRKKEIAGQLARCGELHTNNEFTKAYSCYTDVLQRDSRNEQAQTGAAGIIRDILNSGSRAVGKGDLKVARRQLALLESFAGGKDKAKALQKQIADYEKQQEIAEQKKKEKLRQQREEEQRKAKIAELKQQIRAAEQAENWQEMLTLAQTLLELEADNILATDKFILARRKIAEEKEKASLARLTITPEPADARIRILNIVPPYEPGMQLKPGRYHIEVSAKGYKTKTQWIVLGKQEERELVVSLEKIPPKETFSPAGPWLGATYTDPTTGMEFVYVKGGCYQMGDIFGDGFVSQRPVHEVCVDDFYMGKYEVTQGEWKKIMGSNPSYFKEGDNYPVERVFWDDVQEFIRKLNTKSHRKYRLPTEAEWEYAARSGGKREKYAGGNNVNVVAWYTDNSGGHTHEAGTKQANGLGIYDMSGNVWEWCSDWYDKDYYETSPRNNPKGTSSGSDRVFRGGSWYSYASYARSAIRDRYTPGYLYGSVGFRLALTPGQ